MISIDRRSLLAAGAALSLVPARARAQSAYAGASAYSAARRGVSLLVMQRGRVLFEDYPSPGGADRGWNLASGTKSFCAAIACAAVKDRLLDLDERCSESLREWRGDGRAAITIAQLLSLTSGLGDVGRPLAPPTYAEAIEARLEAEPGTRFRYGAVPFQAFGEIMRRKLGAREDPLAYLTRRVLDPIGIAPTSWRRHRDGMPLLPQGAQFTARDWAAFGAFIIEDGRGLIDARALSRCFAPSSANPGYGVAFWLLREGLIGPTRSMPIDVDEAAIAPFGPIIMAAGAGDQRLYMMPELGLVIARQANEIIRGFRARGEDKWRDGEFLRLILAA